MRGIRRAGSGARKVLGIILAVAGIAIFVSKIPVVVWWMLLGTALVAAGWKLFSL